MKNLDTFKDEMKNLNWNDLYSENNTQPAYSLFHSTFTEKYNKCFPLKKIKKKYFCNKPWLTPVLKEAIKKKNKLYILSK